MSTTTTTYLTTTDGSLGLIEEQGNHSEISADMGDLERSIHYMLSKEIPATEMLDELRLNTVYSLLESLVRYLPLRQPLRNFLVILRDWPAIMEYKALSGAQYKQKVSINSKLFCSAEILRSSSTSFGRISNKCSIG